MDDRVARLESQLEDLSRQVAGLARRLDALEGGPGRDVASAAEETPDATAATLPVTPRALDPGAALTFIGRTLVVLAGAYLLRALTDSGSLAPHVGVGLGIAYALTWVIMADRAGARGRRGSAAFHGVAFVLIGFPLLFEATLRFKFLTDGVSAAALTTLAAVALGVASRQRLRGLAWVTTLGALLTTIVLMTLTAHVGPYAICLVLLGVATLWMGYVLDWLTLRWPVAFVTDLTVLALTLRGISPRSLDSPAMALFVQVLLLALYLGSFASRTLFRGRDIIPFEIVQSIAAIAVGLGGAAFVTRWTGVGALPLGLATLVLGFGCYGVAIAFFERQQRRRRNFHFYAAVALVFTMTGFWLLLPVTPLALAWATCALVTVSMGRLMTSLTMRSHAVAYAAGAAIAGPLFSHISHGLGAPLDLPWPPVGLATTLVLAAIIACAWLALRASPGPSSSRLVRAPGFLLLVLGAGGVMGLAVAWLAPLLVATRPAADAAGVIATLRTAVLVGATLALAWAARAFLLVEAGWLVYPLLVVTGLKFVFEDFQVSRPVTLFAAFALYGVALILAPRLRRR